MNKEDDHVVLFLVEDGGNHAVHDVGFVVFGCDIPEIGMQVIVLQTKASRLEAR